MQSLAKDKNIHIPADRAQLQFIYLPQYAKFILDNKLNEFVEEQLRVSRESAIPISKYFKSTNETEIRDLATGNAKELLQFFSGNKIQECITRSLESWRANILPIIQHEEIISQDISMVSFLHRKVFRDLLSQYSSDIATCIRIMEEVDRFTIELEKACYETLFDLQRERISEDLYFIDKINKTTPGILYVFDLTEQEEIYSNYKRGGILGYLKEDMEAMGNSILLKLTHPEDIPMLIDHLHNFSGAADGEMRTIEYRVKHKTGDYRWLRSYESVFKRNEENIPAQIIGIAIDITDEKEIGLRLKSSEQQLLEAQEIAGMGNFEWNLGKYDSVFSQQLMKILELDTKSDLNTFLQYVHPSDKAKVKEVIDIALQGGGNYECEYRYRKGNSERVIWSRGVVTFKDGKPLKMQGTVMDVTQRYYTLQRLERSEELHKQAQALTHIGNWTWDVRDGKIAWSDELYRIYGLEPQSEEITYDRFMAFVHPEDREKRLKEIQEAIDTHVAKDYLMRIVLNDGSIKVLQGKGQVLVNENNEPYKLVGTCQDVTKQVELNKQLKENEKTFRQLIYNAPDAVIVSDVQGKILIWNPKAKQIFGWVDDEVIGKVLVETIISPRNKQSYFDGLQRLQTSRESRIANKTLEIAGLNKNGREFYIALSMERSRIAGKPVFVSFIRDISREKKAEKELEENRNRLSDLNKSLEQKNQELERSNQELSSFNYIASHDLQEPLRKIKMFTNRILEMYPEALSDDMKGSLSRVLNSAERMKTLIDDLLSFSQTSSGEKVFEWIDLNSLLNEAQSSLKHIIEEKNVRITAARLPLLLVIPFQFQQLLENIISNAIKYSKPNVAPEVRISSTLLHGNQIANDSAKPEREYCRITVTDNGIGFDQQHEARIFQLFQRLHGKSEYSGTGIGLAICKKIAENHHGFITAEGKPGVGSVFNIFIPL